MAKEERLRLLGGRRSSGEKKMQSYTFQICQTTLTLPADLPLVTDAVMERFACTDDDLALLIDCRAVPEVPEPDGEPRLCETERQVWQKGPIVTRCQMIYAGASPYARLDYDLARPEKAVLTVRDADWRWATDYRRLWSTLSLPQLLLPFRTLIFHASSIGWQGTGILFTAPSGTGKSTQAELWRVHRGAEVLNGDKAGVRLDGIPMAHGVPFSGTSGICRNVSLPLKAVVVLSQAPENTIRRLPPSQAVAALCPNVFVDSVVREEWQMALNLLLDLTASVPVYALACTPDERAVETLERAMARDA